MFSRLKVSDYLSGALIFLFIYAAFSKALDFKNFKQQLGLSPLINDIDVNILGWGVIIAEVLICVLLATIRYRKKGYYLSLFLLTVFTTYLIVLLNNDYIPCSCGGILGKMSWNFHILFNSFFIIISIIGIFTDKK